MSSLTPQVLKIQVANGDLLDEVHWHKKLVSALPSLRGPQNWHKGSTAP